MTSPSLLVPNEPFLVEMFAHWQTSPYATIIRDVSAAKEVTREEFLHEVLTVRSSIYESLSDEAKECLLEADRDVFIAMLATPGYGFAVLFFAIFSLGAVAVPLCMARIFRTLTAVGRRQNRG